MRNFGGVPLVDAFKKPEEIAGITRSSVEDCYKFIEADLKAAAEVLPKGFSIAWTGQISFLSHLRSLSS